MMVKASISYEKDGIRGEVSVEHDFTKKEEVKSNENQSNENNTASNEEKKDIDSFDRDHDKDESN